MDHHREPIKHQHADSEAGRSESGQEPKHDGDWRNEKKQNRARYSVAFVNVAKAGDNAEQNRHRIARLWLGRRGCLARPIAAVTRLRILWQSGAAIGTSHGVGADLLRLSWCVRVFHFVKVDNLRSSEAFHSSSKLGSETTAGLAFGRNLIQLPHA